ncbi:hypothetical protein [Schlesneria sp.]|uniref:hypothetical protein n=1 Tax=Schlesneria sp. TaxID=2762018 RepID=UPI002F100BAF
MPESVPEVKVSLTQFLNFATKPPEQQLTVVREIRKQHEEGYDIPPDLYKQFREAVVRMHKNGKRKDYLDAVATGQTEPSRRKHYPPLVLGYKKFLGRKSPTWFDPPEGAWFCEDLRINIRPEVGLLIDGVPTVIKLWLRDDDSLNKRRAELIVHLMMQALPHTTDNLTVCVLDVRKGKAFCAGKSDHEQSALLRAQARSFVSLYRDL